MPKRERSARSGARLGERSARTERVWRLPRALSAVWRQVRSMRTALILLLVVGLASVAGSLVPQAANSPARVSRIYAEHPTLARIGEALGLFDVYGSWWFTLAYVLLLVSLASCLIPRSRAALRGLRQRPQPARELETMPHFAQGVVPGTPDAALERARRLFRRRRYRVEAGDGAGLAAEKGRAREWGSLAFHGAFFLLLVGVIYGKGNGLTGVATVVEGETWTEAHASYDLPPREGRFFSESDHTGFQVRVLDFEASFRETGVPRDFVSRVQVIEDGRVVSREDVRVNHPLEHGGVKVYQQGYGWAPVIEVRADGELLAGDPVVFVTRDPLDPRRPWEGVIKLPSLRPQVGVEFRLLPDPRALLLGAPVVEARDPFLLYTAYRGDLRLTAAQNVFTLDRAGLRRFGRGGLGLGQATELPGGVEISFSEIRQYTQFLVTRDPGTPIVLVSAILVLAGLLPALYSSRRKLWARAVASGRGTVLQVAGVALQRRAAFQEEFRDLAGELVGETAGRVLVPR